MESNESTNICELEAIAKQKGVPIDSTSRDDLVYMQYTGLKDKNDREIYEGDILAVHVFRSGRNIRTLYIIKWSHEDCGFVIQLLGRKDVTFSLRDLQVDPSVTWYEVIGNIFENELRLRGGL